jgi:iron complex outermembrane receptor protein
VFRTRLTQLCALRFRRLCAAALVCTLLCGHSASSAENPEDTDSEDSWSEVEEMTVVGESNAMAVEETPTSTVSFDAWDLSVERIQNISDLANLTPNLQINTPFAASNPIIFIRGVGLDDFNANSNAGVAIYQDGVYMNSPAGQLFQFFDAKGVEVLRGPYGGRFRNASAGAILIESIPPSHEIESFAQFTYGNYSLLEGSAAINIPVVQDILASRTSMFIQKREGYTQNRCYGKELTRPNVQNPDCVQPRFPGYNLGYPVEIHERVNDADNFAARTQLLLDVPLNDSDMQWLLNLHGGQNRSQASQFQHRGVKRLQGATGGLFPAPDASSGGRGYQDTDGDAFAGDYNTGGDENLDLFGASLTGTWDIFEGHTITSISGYEWHDRDTLQNTDANPRDLLVVRFTDTAWQFSQDLRLNSDWAETFNTSVGAFFIMEDLSSENFIDQQTAFAVLTQGIDQKMKSFSVYGTLSWNFSERLSFDGNLRFSRESKDFAVESAQLRAVGNGCPGRNGRGIQVPFNGGIACQNGITSGRESDVFRGWAGGAALTYDVAEDGTKSVYIKYSRGWKPGHFNGGAFTSQQLIDPVKPDTVNSYEGGVRSTWLDDMIQINGAFFYYQYENIQIFQIESDIGVGPLPQLINAQGAEIFGVEIDLVTEPIEGLDISLSAAYLNTKYSKFETSLFEVIPQLPGDLPPPSFIETPVVYTGNRMVAAPQWSMTGSVQYTLPVGRLGELIPRFSFSYKDDVYFDVAEGRGIRDTPEKPALPTGTIGQEAYWLLNAALTWMPPSEALTIGFWVRNILEEEYRVQSFDLTDDTFRAIVDAYAPPRTFGVTVTLRY